MKWTGRFRTGGLFGGKLFVEMTGLLPSPPSVSRVREGCRYLPLDQTTLQAMAEELMDVRKRLADYERRALSAQVNLGGSADADVEEVCNIIDKVFSNNELRQKIQQGFASGGYFDRQATDRFGEAATAQVRRTDTPTEEPFLTGLRRAMEEMPQAAKLRINDYPGACFKLPPFQAPPRETCMGYQPIPTLTERDATASPPKER